jgi:HTH-type transcriptional regulator, competence development regulator
MKFDFSKEWCRKSAELEGNAEVGAGCPDVGQDRPVTDTVDFAVSARLAFGRFLQLMRRNRGFTPEQLAVRADIDLQEIVSIEGDVRYVTEPRTVYQLALVFSLPEKRLMQLAGLTHAQDPKFAQQAVRFAAQSESVEKLNLEERRALESFIALLSSKD